MNLDLITYAVTQPNTGAAMAPVTGDPAQIRNSIRGKDVFGIAGWAHTQSVNGFTQIVWPSGHDQVRGYRTRNIAALNQLFPTSFPLAFKPQDPLTVTQSGSNTAGDVQTASLLLWYEQLPGVDAHLINFNELMRRGVQSLTIEDTLTPTGGGVTYSGARALNAASDLLKADTLYAVTGFVVGARNPVLSVRGPDTGNMRFGGPAEPNQALQTRQVFSDLSLLLDLPTIPVINAANRAGTFAEVMGDENNTAMPFALHLVELGSQK